MMMASRLPATLLSVAALLVASTSAAIAAVPTVSAVPGTTNSNATVDRNARFQNCFGYPYDYGYGSRPYYPHYKRDGKSKDSVSWFGSCIIAPKVLIISLFEPEADVWYNIPQFDLLELNITVAGLSPLFPQVHCTFDAEVCQVTLGEAGKLGKRHRRGISADQQSRDQRGNIHHRALAITVLRLSKNILLHRRNRRCEPRDRDNSFGHIRSLRRLRRPSV